MRQLPLEPGWDVVLIARPPAAGADYTSLYRQVAGLLKEAGLMAA